MDTPIEYANKLMDMGISLASFIEQMNTLDCSNSWKLEVVQILNKEIV